MVYGRKGAPGEFPISRVALKKQDMGVTRSCKRCLTPIKYRVTIAEAAEKHMENRGNLTNSNQAHDNDLYEKIVKLIQCENLKNGDRLPPERTLAKRLNVSRNTVRKTIKDMAAQGLLVTRQGSGTFISGDKAEYEENCVLDVCFSNKYTLEQLFEFRFFLECSIVELSAERIDQNSLNALKAILYDQQRARAMGNDESPYIRDFHQKLAETTRNPIFIALMQALNKALGKRRKNADENNLLRRKISHHWHHNIIDALEKGDREKCVSEMRRHILNSMGADCPLPIMIENPSEQ